jgi:hypothetical protein
MSRSTMMALMMTGDIDMRRYEPTEEEIKLDRDDSHHVAELEKEKQARKDLESLKSNPADDSEEEDRRHVEKKRVIRRLEIARKKTKKKPVPKRDPPTLRTRKIIPGKNLSKKEEQVLERRPKNSESSPLVDEEPKILKKRKVEPESEENKKKGPKILKKRRIEPESEDTTNEVIPHPSGPPPDFLSSSNPLPITEQVWHFVEPSIADDPLFHLDRMVCSSEYPKEDRTVIMTKIKETARSGVPRSRTNLREEAFKTQELHPREYEDELLRVKKSPEERDCCMGEKCQGFKYNKDILREVMFESDRKHYLESGEIPPPGRCLRCHRYDVQYLLVNTRAECKNSDDFLYSKFYNIPDKKGEYPTEILLLSSRKHHQASGKTLFSFCDPERA